MTIDEFHVAFDIELDKTLDFEYPYIMPEKKDYWLNKAQQRFVEERTWGNNLHKTSFEESQKRIDDLQTIVSINNSITPTISGNIYSSTLPSNYMHLVRHQCDTSTTVCTTLNRVTGTQVTNGEIDILSKDPFWKPISSDPFYYIANGKIIYETGGDFIVSNTVITYIRQYNQMRYGSQYISPLTDVQCELPIHTHHEILDIAIAMILENIESTRYQTNLNELTKSE